MNTDTKLPLATTEQMPLDKSIIIPGIGQTIVIPEATITRRDDILTQSKAVRAVFDDQTRDAALTAIRELKNFRLDADKAREAAKAPINALAKQVEAKIADFCRETGCGSGESKQGPEEKRLLQLVTRHEADLRRQREEAERKAAAERYAAEEADRERQREIIRREEEAKRKLQEAEDARMRAERARTDTSKEKQAEIEAQARAAAEKAQEEAEELAIAAEQAALDARQREREEQDRLAALSIPVAGLTVKKVWTYEINNILAFAREWPDLCKIEIKHREVLEAINAGTFDYTLRDDEKSESPESMLTPNILRTAPGLRIFRKDELKVR